MTLTICLGGAFTGAYAAAPNPLPGNASGQDTAETEEEVVFHLSSNGHSGITKSDSFEAEDDQILTITIQSDIKGGSVDLFLFSPDNKEQRITINDSDETKTITLSAGRWLIIVPDSLRVAVLPFAARFPAVMAMVIVPTKRQRKWRTIKVLS